MLFFLYMKFKREPPIRILLGQMRHSSDPCATNLRDSPSESTRLGWEENDAFMHMKFKQIRGFFFSGCIAVSESSLLH